MRPGSNPPCRAICSSPAEATSQPRPSSASSRATAVQGKALEPNSTSEGPSWWAPTASTKVRARARMSSSATTYAGVPNSRASSMASQPPTSRRPRSLRRLPSGYTCESWRVAAMAWDYRRRGPRTHDRERRRAGTPPRPDLRAVAARGGAGGRGDRAPRRRLVQGEPLRLRPHRTRHGPRGAGLRPARPRRQRGPHGGRRDRRRGGDGRAAARARGGGRRGHTGPARTARLEHGGLHCAGLGGARRRARRGGDLSGELRAPPGRPARAALRVRRRRSRPRAAALRARRRDGGGGARVPAAAAARRGRRAGPGRPLPRAPRGRPAGSLPAPRNARRPPPLDTARRRAAGRVAALRAARVRGLAGPAEAVDGVSDGLARLRDRVAGRLVGAPDGLAGLVGHAGDGVPEAL